jgi:hypothetical protein
MWMRGAGDQAQGSRSWNERSLAGNFCAVRPKIMNYEVDVLLTEVQLRHAGSARKFAWIRRKLAQAVFGPFLLLTSERS